MLSIVLLPIHEVKCPLCYSVSFSILIRRKYTFDINIVDLLTFLMKSLLRQSHSILAVLCSIRFEGFQVDLVSFVVKFILKSMGEESINYTPLGLSISTTCRRHRLISVVHQI